jgi:hypothetical protein
MGLPPRIQSEHARITLSSQYSSPCARPKQSRAMNTQRPDRRQRRSRSAERRRTGLAAATSRLGRGVAGAWASPCSCAGLRRYRCDLPLRCHSPCARRGRHRRSPMVLRPSLTRPHRCSSHRPTLHPPLASRRFVLRLDAFDRRARRERTGEQRRPTTARTHTFFHSHVRSHPAVSTAWLGANAQQDPASRLADYRTLFNSVEGRLH